MTKRLMFSVIMAGALALPAVARPSGDGEPNPRAVVHRSLTRIHRVARHVIPAMHRRARHCALLITRLLENEEPQRAAEVAERCINGINHLAERGGAIIGETAERAVNALTEMEAPEELIQIVRTAAERALNAIQEHRAATVQMVRDALAGSPPE